MKADITFQITPVILGAAIAFIRASVDTKKIENKNEPLGKSGYLKRNLWTALGILGAGVIDWILGPTQYLFQPTLLIWMIFWIIFDDILNLLRGKPFGYIGGDTDLSPIEKLYKRTPIYGIYLAKFWALSVAIGVYYYLSYII